VQIARALVLDVGHRVLALKGQEGGWFPPATIARVGERPLVALTSFARERIGLTLPHPSGALPATTPHDFTFVLPPGAHVDSPDTTWFPLAELSRLNEHDALWSLYVESMLGGWEPPTRELDVFHFGRDPRTAAGLAHMVVKGAKRATALWPDAARAKKETIPAPGLVSVVTDGFGFPVCVVRTERVEESRFGDVDESVAKDEAEGDGTLDDWRDGHRAYFTGVAKDLGLTFDDDAIVMVERFRVLKVLSR
jgi:uncharacterized protein YhfF